MQTLFHRKFLKLCMLCMMVCHYVTAEEEVEMRFVSFPKDAGREAFELRIGDAQPLIIDTPTNKISKAYMVPHQEHWVIGRSKKSGSGSDFTVLGKTQALNSGQQLILILGNEQADGGGLLLIPVDTSTSGFSGGKHLLVNHSADVLSGAFGEEEFLIEKESHAILRPFEKGSASAASTNMLPILIRQHKSNRPFLSSTWRIHPDARSLVLLYQDRESGHIRLHTIRDYH